MIRRPAGAVRASLSVVTPARPPTPLFPYTTLFRSRRAVRSGNPPDGEHRAAERHEAPDCPHPGASCLRSEEHTSELQSHSDLVCRLLLEKKNRRILPHPIARDREIFPENLHGEIIR